MNQRLISLTAISTGFLFMVGFAGLFVLNPQTYEELNHLSLVSYNIPGMNARVWVALVAYGLTGAMNILFVTGLLLDKPSKPADLVGKILLAVSGVIWLSFGLICYDPTTDIASHVLLIRLIGMITTSFIGLLLLSIEYPRIHQDKLLKWFTLLSACLILILSFLSIFVYNDDTWIRTNVSLTVYFVWCIIFGLCTLFPPRRVTRFRNSA